MSQTAHNCKRCFVSERSSSQQSYRNNLDTPIFSVASYFLYTGVNFISLVTELVQVRVYCDRSIRSGIKFTLFNSIQQPVF